MSDHVVTNWFGDLASHPKVIVEARTVEDIREILTDPVPVSLPGASGRIATTRPPGVASRTAAPSSRCRR